MKREFFRTNVLNKEGKIVPAFIPSESIKPESFRWGRWTPELKEYKEKRVVEIENHIIKIQKILDEDEKLSDYERLVLMFFIDQLNVDLREDKHRIKYRGNIPPHIDERCVKKASKSFSKYRRFGEKIFNQLKEDVNVLCWGNVIVDEHATSGGGKAN